MNLYLKSTYQPPPTSTNPIIHPHSFDVVVYDVSCLARVCSQDRVVVLFRSVPSKHLIPIGPKGSDSNFNPLSQYHFCRSFSSCFNKVQSCSRLRFCIEFCKPQCNFPFFNSHPRYNSIHLNKLFQHEAFHPRNPSFLCCCLCSPGKQVHICSYPGCYGRPCSYR